MRHLRWRRGLSVLVLDARMPSEDNAIRIDLRDAIDELDEPVEVTTIPHRADGPLDLLANALRHARHDAVYLLDARYGLHRHALRDAMRHRAPHVVAVASRRLPFGDEDQGHMQTGWSTWRRQGERLEAIRLDPAESLVARGSAYAPIGSSLFHRETLQRWIDSSGTSAEAAADLAFGIHAWRANYEVRFVPTSRVHLAAYAQRDLAPDRNAIRVGPGAFEPDLDAPDLEYVHACAFPMPWDASADRPTVLVVSPYGIFPPEDAGTRVIASMVEAASECFNVVLLCDERDRHDLGQTDLPPKLAALHLADGRHEPPEDVGLRIPRIRNHSHPKLRAALTRLIERYRPALVQLEHIELAGLLPNGKRRTPWVMDLHRPVLREGEPGRTPDDVQECNLLARFDEVVDWNHPGPDLTPQRETMRPYRTLRAFGRRLRHALTSTAIRAAEVLGPRLPKMRRPAPTTWSEGISVILPERGRPDLLREALASLAIAITRVREPVEVCLIVNGAEPSDYASLQAEYPSHTWLFVERALGFGNAIRRALKSVRYDWVYLQNTDARLDPNALHALLEWRAPHVSALASQVFMADDAMRRIDTGWTALTRHGTWIEPQDVEPDGTNRVRGAFFAGGGASLFHTRTLRRRLRRGDPYAPFYMEDVEWGTRSWREGFEVLFVPASKVWHHWRGTIARFHTKEEVERVWRRNLVLYQLRNNTTVGATALHRLDPRSRRELSSPWMALRIFWARLQTHRMPASDVDLDHCHLREYPRSGDSIDGALDTRP